MNKTLKIQPHLNQNWVESIRKCQLSNENCQIKETQNNTWGQAEKHRTEKDSLLEPSSNSSIMSWGHHRLGLNSKWEYLDSSITTISKRQRIPANKNSQVPWNAGKLHITIRCHNTRMKTEICKLRILDIVVFFFVYVTHLFCKIIWAV